MMKENFFIYGSYGYTGNLIAKVCLEQGLKPILAGRDQQKLKQQAEALDLEYRVFDVNNLEQTKNALKEPMAVINCAGPFKYTYKNMSMACVATKTHYLDITGEFMVIEQLMSLNEQAKNAGVMLLPGAGFDVVPSDCLAAYLKTRLPNANRLVLAIAAFQNNTKFNVSQGTARTMLEGLAEGTTIREQGILKRVPLCWKTRSFDFGVADELLCATVSWGDLASAWWSTKIPQIETYMALPKKVIKLSKLINPIKEVFNWYPIKRYIEHKIDQLPDGPSVEERQNSFVKIYGEVINHEEKKIAAIVTTPNGYTFTALSTLAIMQQILSGNAPPGFQTPSSAYAEDLIMKIPGVTRIMVN